MVFLVSLQSSISSLAVTSIASLPKTQLTHFITRYRGCSKIAAIMTNETAWAKQRRSRIEVKPIEVWSPCLREILVTNKSISFNFIEARIQSQIPYSSTLQAADYNSDFDKD